MFKMKPIPAGYRFSNSDLKRLIIPLIIEQSLVQIVGLMDTVMVAAAGEAAMSGVSLVNMINVLFIGLFSALATGGAVVVAQKIGAKDSEGARGAAYQLFWFALMFCSAVMLLCIILRRPMFSLFFGNVEKDVFDHAIIYFLITAMSYPFQGIYNVCAALFRAMGNSKISMKMSAIMNIINVTGNAILILGFDMAAAGAAIATLIANIVAAVVVMALMCNKHQEIYIDFKQKFHPDTKVLSKIMSISIPSGLENSLFQLGKLLTGSVIAAFGTVSVAANAVSTNMCSLACIPGQAMGLSILTVVGQCVGAKDEEQTRFYVKKLMTYSRILMGISSIAVVVILPLVLPLYNLSSQSGILAFKLTALHSAFAVFFWAMSFSFPNVLRASNNPRYTMGVSIVSMAVFRVGLSYLLGLGFGLGAIGVYIAMIVDWVGRGTSFGIFYLKGYWRKNAGFEKA